MGRLVRILARIGVSLLATAAGMALYYGLGLVNPSRAFAPVQVVPLLLSVFFVTVRIGGTYGLIPFLLPPILNIVLQNIDPDPMNTPFILTVILLFELAFTLVSSRVLRVFVRNRLLLTIGSYVATVALTFATLKFGLFPFLPLLSLPTILWNFLYGDGWYALVGLAVFVAGGVFLCVIKSKLLREEL